MRFQPGFRYGPSQAVIAGALYLLTGETDGFAIDATTYDSVTAAAYVGGPVGGTVATIDTGTPSNDLSDVPLDASNLTQSGTSPKMVHHAASPYVRWSAHNYFTQSQTLNSWGTKQNCTVSSDATTAPDGTTTADSLVEVSDTNQFHFVRHTPHASTAGFVYTGSIYAKASGRTRVAFCLTLDGSNQSLAYFDLSGGALVAGSEAGSGSFAAPTTSITDAGGGWWRLTVTAVSPSTTLGLTVFTDNGSGQGATDVQFDGSGASAVYLWGGQLNRGPIATPYLVTTTAARIGIPLSYDAAAAQYGILVEPAATNLVVQSQEMTTGAGWSLTGLSSSADAVVAPDGTTTAETLTGDGASNTHSIASASISFTTGTAYTFSVYAKAGTGNFVQLLGGNAVFPDIVVYANFDLSGGGAVGTKGTSTTTSSIEAVGNGWFRCSFTATTDASTTSTFVACVATSSSMGRADTTTTTNSIHLWGAQIETGSVATSYIPTLGSTVTRAVDNPGAALSSLPFSTSAGTLAARFIPRLGTVSGGGLVTTLLYAGGETNGSPHIAYGVSNDFYGAIYGDGGSVIDSGDPSPGAENDVKYAFTSGDSAFRLNSTQNTNADAFSPAIASNTTLFLGGVPTTNKALNGHILYAVYVPRRVTDGDLPTWSFS
jgi:hypothetical protein